VGIKLPTVVASKSSTALPEARPRALGKFIFVGGEKFLSKGVTYGAFKPDNTGAEYHDLDKVAADFKMMAAAGINTVRIPHTMPPRALLDLALSHGLKVMVGLSAEQYAGFLIDPEKKGPDVAALIRAKVKKVAGHPALLCYAIGNEISAPVVRWLGARTVENYLGRICKAIKAEDPEGLVTYVNYPTTEYLQLPFLDLLCFNVYLESEAALHSYLLRLQNIADDRPLIMSEIGLDAMRNGEEKQAAVLDWQIRTTFRAGCAGAIVFSWTDEWFRGDDFVHDWAFGLTDTLRRPKPALTAVTRAFADTPFPVNRPTPRFSVVICTYNGSATIRKTLEVVQELAYPNYEVIVVDDGSTDVTAKIVREYGVRLISTANQGLSEARNVGFRAATGEFVVYLDDDAFPDPDWLNYLAASFLETEHVAIGGPNVEPPESGLVATCVANAPGGPVHVLITDELAEHIPGCNMAFRRKVLEAVGGFDPQFRAAGDDVDICWRIQERGWTIGFSPAALVWHHRRDAILKYCKQQRGYGRAEALLEAKWPERYNSAGHHTFNGRIYGKGFGHILGLGSRIYHGVWGSAPFQSLCHRRPNTLLCLPSMPEWHLMVWFLALCSLMGFSWRPLFIALPLLLAAVSITALQCLRAAARSSFAFPRKGIRTEIQLRLLTAWLHFIQPLARLFGRLEYGLTFWRPRGTGAIEGLESRLIFPFNCLFHLMGYGSTGFPPLGSRKDALWTKDWIAPEERVAGIWKALRNDGAIAQCGDGFGRWDIEVRAGMFGAARLLVAVEDHGGGAQYVRTRIWPHWFLGGKLLVLVFALLAAGAAWDNAWVATAICGTIAMLVGLWAIRQSGRAVAMIWRATSHLRTEESPR
jgi:O-antigen biosynthesis protein